MTAALHDGPLVTLTGVGGVGKTSLAFEAAEHEQGRFGDGVSICELAPIEDGSAVTHAVAAALRLQQQQGLGIEETVIEYLRTRELLLVVDNCEHVLDDAARLLDQIAAHCPRVSLLATSREALGVRGRADHAGRTAVGRRRHHAVRRSSQGEPAGLRPRTRAGRRGRRDLPPTRRPAAGDRAGGGSDARDEQPRRRATLRQSAASQRWHTRCDAEATKPRGDDRLVVSAAFRTRAGLVCAAVGVRRRVRPRRSARCVRRGRHDRGRHPRSADRARRQVDGDRAGRRRQDALRRPGDTARLRPGTPAGQRG